MINLENSYIKGFSDDQVYIIKRSLVDAWGYPYRPEKIELLKDRSIYKSVNEKFRKSEYTLQIEDLSVVINALELLLFENIDFEALYRIAGDDIRLLLDELKEIDVRSIH